MDPDRLDEIVAATPPGRWMSYGDVARGAGGTDRHARVLNQRFMRASTPGAHRVLKGDGSVGATALGDPGEVRRRLPPGPYLVVGLARSGVAAALALRARDEPVTGVDSGGVAPERRAELEAAGVPVHER